VRRLAFILALVLSAVPAACRKSDGPPGSTEARSPVAALGTADATMRAGEAGEPPAAGDATAGPAATPPTRAGCAGSAAQRFPGTSDPASAPFTLAAALAGLPGDGLQLTATLETTAGVLSCVLDAEGAPRTVANFVGLARGVRDWWDPCRGAWVREPLYDGMKFHKLEAGFVAQAGCPIGDGTGGPGYAIPDEIRPAARLDAPGVLAMAGIGPGSAGSQFFVTLAATPELDRRFTVFGRCAPSETLGRLDEAARDGGEVVIRTVKIERTQGERSGGAT
jgi:peptidyl-prolyl cis-trans isomerase A (cyclophilin A)